MQKLISLHPYIAAFFELMVGLGLFFVLYNIHSLTEVGVWFLVRFAVTGILVALVYCPPPLKRLHIMASLIFSQLGFSLTLILLDQKIITMVAGCGAVVLNALVFALLPATVPELSFAFKPARRARLMLALVGIFGLWSTLFALSTLQLLNSVEFLTLWIFVSVTQVAVAVWWWYEYGIPVTKQMLTSAGVLLLLTLETSGFLWWWPIGYLAAALLLVWWWYVLWLLIRFHLTPEGIVWKKQVPFLIINLVVLFLFIFFIIRWK